MMGWVMWEWIYWIPLEKKPLLHLAETHEKFSYSRKSSVGKIYTQSGHSIHYSGLDKNLRKRFEQIPGGAQIEAEVIDAHSTQAIHNNQTYLGVSLIVDPIVKTEFSRI